MPRGSSFHPPVPETLSRRTRRAIFRVRKLTVPAIPGRPKRPSRVLSRPVTDLKPPCRAAVRSARLCRKSFPAEHAGYISRPEADGAHRSRTPQASVPRPVPSGHGLEAAMPRGGLFHPPVPEMFSRRTRRAIFRVRKLTAPTVPGRPSVRPASCPVRSRT